MQDFQFFGPNCVDKISWQGGDHFFCGSFYAQELCSYFKSTESPQLTAEAMVDTMRETAKVIGISPVGIDIERNRIEVLILANRKSHEAKSYMKVLMRKHETEKKIDTYTIMCNSVEEDIVDCKVKLAALDGGDADYDNHVAFIEGKVEVLEGELLAVKAALYALCTCLAETTAERAAVLTKKEEEIALKRENKKEKGPERATSANLASLAPRKARAESNQGQDAISMGLSQLRTTHEKRKRSDEGLTRNIRTRYVNSNTTDDKPDAFPTWVELSESDADGWDELEAEGDYDIVYFGKLKHIKKEKEDKTTKQAASEEASKTVTKVPGKSTLDMSPAATATADLVDTSTANVDENMETETDKIADEDALLAPTDDDDNEQSFTST